MKNLSALILRTAFILPFIVYSQPAFSQMQHGGEPYAASYGLNLDDLIINEKVLDLSPEQEHRRQYHSGRMTPPGEAMHAGFPISTDITPETHGVKTVRNGKQVWQMKIRSPEAGQQDWYLKIFTFLKVPGYSFMTAGWSI